MKFIFGGESVTSYLDRLSIRGMFGITYNSTLTGVLAFLISVGILVLAVIGLKQVLKWAIESKKKK